MKIEAVIAGAVLSLMGGQAFCATVTTVTNFGTGETSTSGLGKFGGFFKYTHISGQKTASLELSITNLLATGEGGKITAIALNLAGTPNVGLGGFTTTSGHSSFGLFANPSQTSPWGAFEYSVALGSNFNGSGSPNPGVVRGATGVFKINVLGVATVLESLSASSFLSQTTSGPTSTSTAMLVRFKGFDDGGSDKVSGIPVEVSLGSLPSIPLPSAGLATGVMLGGMLARRRR